MSVHRYQTADGPRWQVRWRDGNGRVRTRSLTSKSEAKALDADVKARKHRGDALPQRGRETLAAAFDEWWRLRGSTLAGTTQRTYLAAWDAHVRDRFDHHRLDQLSADPRLFEDLMADLRERGVGNAAQRKVLMVMSAVLTCAVEWQRMPTNPLWRVRKPPVTRQRIPRPFPPLVLERIRQRMLQRETKDASGARATADACLLGLMGYAGLRPGEALALTWRDLGGRTIAVDKAVSDGVEATTKTGGVRSVPLVTPLRDDLDDRYLKLRSPSANSLILPAHDGGHWSRSELNNWRNRVWKPVMDDLAQADADLAHLASARPYDCRGSFVSLHLRAGVNPLEVAQWAGHSPAVMFKHYANVIEELADEPRISVVDQIVRARKLVRDLSERELDALTCGVLAQPTIGGEVVGWAAEFLYGEKGAVLDDDPDRSGKREVAEAVATRRGE